MKMTKICSLLLALLLFATVAQAAPQTASTIAVQGNASLHTVPDQATINIGVTTSAASLKEAETQNSSTASLIHQQLLSLGIAQDNIRTSNYSVYPVYNQQNKGKTPVITGYNLSNVLTVTVDDISSIGEVIDTALAAGANQISSINFSKKDESKLQQEALQLAVKDGYAKAEAIANALNKKIARVVTVNEQGVSVQFPEAARYALKADSLGGTPIAPGNIQVNANVSIVFEIQ